VRARTVRPESPGCPRVEGPASPATTVQIERTAPSLSLDLPGANANGWNNTPVTAAWTCTDPAGGSGIDESTCPATTTYEHGTDLAAADLVVRDVAGNHSAPVTRRAIKVDTVAPDAPPTRRPGARSRSTRHRPR
jgi:hypothetical protein